MMADYPTMSILSSLLFGFVTGAVYGHKRGVPFVRTLPTEWAIGVRVGRSPLELHGPARGRNPVLSAASVTDVPAKFVADPFLIRHNGIWHMFFEVLNSATRKGEIGVAYSNDGHRWRYGQIVLSEPFHLSYPYVFSWQGEHYLVPETYQTDAVRLYKAETFPTRWQYVCELVSGRPFVDASMFFYAGHWWMFVGVTSNDSLFLYRANRPEGPWFPHPCSPVVTGDTSLSRPGGRVLVHDGRVFRFAQDDSNGYGRTVRVFEITRLAVDAYAEQEACATPLLGPHGRVGWNAIGMHHIDVQPDGDGGWIAAVDGRGRRRYILGVPC